ncbi:peptide methionine sulfoxide reductase [Maribacter algicola]|uniref:Peptide methionine sulfoxide reductase n=1 Tax=Maribacter algicola TaxID=2498892 RepID=A0A3R8PYZ6_9FLAO|nr:peptide methionine sulfoxide reductase [Maribacter algicola]RRQ48827.1 peptide methionine sulfoxide reductase [Maribacter algicola]
MDFKKIPEGYSEGIYKVKKYGITKKTFNHGKSFKLFAEELGGSDFISLNNYKTKQKELLKPCEMSEAKVVDFINKVKLLEPKG